MLGLYGGLVGGLVCPGRGKRTARRARAGVTAKLQEQLPRPLICRVEQRMARSRARATGPAGSLLAFLAILALQGGALAGVPVGETLEYLMETRTHQSAADMAGTTRFGSRCRLLLTALDPQETAEEGDDLFLMELEDCATLRGLRTSPFLTKMAPTLEDRRMSQFPFVFARDGAGRVTRVFYSQEDDDRIVAVYVDRRGQERARARLVGARGARFARGSELPARPTFASSCLFEFVRRLLAARRQSQRTSRPRCTRRIVVCLRWPARRATTRRARRVPQRFSTSARKTTC